MIRRQRIVLWREDIERLDKARIRKGWTREDNSEALIEASRYLLELFIEEYNHQYQQESYKISLKVLKSWVTQDTRRKDDSKKLYCKNTWNFSYFETNKKELYIKDNQITNKRTQEIDDSLIELNFEDIDHLLEEFILAAIGISQDSLRWCTEWTYYRRRKRKKPKSMPTYVIEAYCEVLGVPFETLQSNQSHQKLKDERTNNEKIYNVLTGFNYTETVNYLRNIAPSKSRKGIIYVPPSSRKFQVWGFRRIEREIRSINGLEVYSICYNPTIHDCDFPSLLQRFYLNNGDIKQLSKHNYIIIFEQLDYLSLESVEQNIIEFWKFLIKQMKPAKGFLLMVWQDGGQPNDWRDKFASLEKIYHFPKLPYFHQQDFSNILPIFAEQLQLPNLIMNQAAELDNLWQTSNHGQIEETLTAFYQRFRGQLAREERWLNYP